MAARLLFIALLVVTAVPSGAAAVAPVRVVRHGPICTEGRCAPGAGNPASHLAGFGAAVLGAFWLSRRRHRQD